MSGNKVFEMVVNLLIIRYSTLINAIFEYILLLTCGVSIN